MFPAWAKIKGRLIRCIERERARRLEVVVKQRKTVLHEKFRPHFDQFWECRMSRGDLLLGWLPKIDEAILLPAVDKVFSENNSDIELTENRICCLVDILDQHFTYLKAVNERKLLSELQLVYPQLTDPSGTALSDTMVQDYLQRASSIFVQCKTNGSMLGILCNFQEALQHRDVFFGRVENLKGHARASMIAKEAIRILGFPESLPAQYLPRHFACSCGKLNRTISFVYLVQHLLDELEWYEDMVVNLYVFRLPEVMVVIHH